MCSDGIVLAGDALDIKVDRAQGRAGRASTPTPSPSSSRPMFSGVVTTQVQQGIKMVGVRVWMPEPMRRD